MKRLIALACVLAVVLLGCAKEAPTAIVTTIDGQEAAITFLDATMSAGEIATKNGAYTFAYLTDGTLEIGYPDGGTYARRVEAGAVLVPADYDAAEVEKRNYLPGDALAEAIDNAIDNGGAGKAGGFPVLLSVLLLALGLWLAVSPKSAWWLARGWWFKNAEPSGLALTVYRGTGCFILLCGALSFFA